MISAQILKCFSSFLVKHLQGENARKYVGQETMGESLRGVLVAGIFDIAHSIKMCYLVRCFVPRKVAIRRSAELLCKHQ